MTGGGVDGEKSLDREKGLGDEKRLDDKKTTILSSVVVT